MSLMSCNHGFVVVDLYASSTALFFKLHQLFNQAVEHCGQIGDALVYACDDIVFHFMSLDPDVILGFDQTSGKRESNQNDDSVGSWFGKSIENSAKFGESTSDIRDYAGREVALDHLGNLFHCIERTISDIGHRLHGQKTTTQLIVARLLQFVLALSLEQEERSEHGSDGADCASPGAPIGNRHWLPVVRAYQCIHAFVDGEEPPGRHDRDADAFPEFHSSPTTISLSKTCRRTAKRLLKKHSIRKGLLECDRVRDMRFDPRLCFGCSLGGRELHSAVDKYHYMLGKHSHLRNEMTELYSFHQKLSLRKFDQCRAEPLARKEDMDQPNDLLHEAKKLRLLAAVLELQYLTSTAANVVPIPGAERVIAIGTAADVAKLLPGLGGGMAELIDLLKAIRPNYGAVDSRDIDVAAQQQRIDRAVELLENGSKRMAALDFLPELYRWLARAHFARSGDEATAARFGEQIKRAIGGQEGGAS